MAAIAAIERTLNALDDVPPESRDVVEWMNKLYLLYLKIGYLEDDDVYHPLNPRPRGEDPADWREHQDWDKTIVAALPWLPTASYYDEMGPNITPGATGYLIQSRGFAREGRKLFGCLDLFEDTLPNYALPLTDGNKWAPHWIWDAKEGLIRTYDYEGPITDFEEMPGVPVAEKFELLMLQIENLDVVPWCGKLHNPPHLDRMREARQLGDPRWSLDANTFMAAKKAYFGAGWAGEAPLGTFDPQTFRLSDFLTVRNEWDERMEAIKHLDYEEFARAENDVATEMAGDRAFSKVFSSVLL